ncbi:hypothetical protein KEM48_007425 [Puccinia striiformis f. sp. tritici PST-130]|nr:hypothetical protein KEM48_007425 [Puccinia striiformis f. sp. tritici PST-130]KNE97768.1 hypothetical protein PSTG_08985 [Puccinia striiformis f. sp. tritici PST-78]POW14259.1 hypothetical protein PSTT_03102 [Puccinia striiformis]
MIFVSSVPVLVAILVIATVSSVASTTTGCPPSYQPCQGKGKNHCCFTLPSAKEIKKCSTIRHRLVVNDQQHRSEPASFVIKSPWILFSLNRNTT